MEIAIISTFIHKPYLYLHNCTLSEIKTPSEGTDIKTERLKFKILYTAKIFSNELPSVNLSVSLNHLPNLSHHAFGR